MKPDLEWRIGDEAGEEMVAQTRPPVRSRWRTLAMTLVVCVGISLGIMYSAIPEPPPQPAPTPTMTRPPTQLPSPMIDHDASDRQLVTVIEREAQALAGGDERLYMNVQDPTDQAWRQSQQAAFRAWGRPPSDRFAPLYFYSGLDPADVLQGRAWIDIRQWRDDGYFRETRFYRLIDAQWMRVRPDGLLWRGEQRTLFSQHFELNMPAADDVFARTLLERFEAVYAQLCRDLACGDDTAIRTTKIALIVQPEMDHTSRIEIGSRVIITLPSPRITGLIDIPARLDRRDPLTDIAYHRLIEVAARSAAGGLDRWQQSRDGLFFLTGVMQWEFDRLSGQANVDGLVQPESLRGRRLTLPKYLWDWPIRDSRRLNVPQAQANSVIVFIDQSFGASRVIKFLNALGAAKSLPRAIEASVPMTYDDFEKQWKAWIIKQLSN